MARPTKPEIKAFKAHCRTLVTDKKQHSRVFQVFTEPGYDYDDGPSAGGGRWDETVKKVGLKGMVRLAGEEYANSGLIHNGPDHKPRLPDTAEEVIGYAYLAMGGEAEGVHVNMYTLKDWAKQVEEAQRKRCEPLVSRICQKYKVKPNSLAMVAALHKHYQNIMDSERRFRDDPEVRAERYAMCVMGGAGRDAFYADNDYSSGLSAEAADTLSDALDYLRKYCPLLMARWDERKRKGKDGE